jgi:hypothetical protein
MRSGKNPNITRVVLDLDSRVYNAVATAGGSAEFSLLNPPNRIKAILFRWVEAQGIVLPPAPAPRSLGRPKGAKDSPSCRRAKTHRKRLARRSETAVSELPA